MLSTFIFLLIVAVPSFANDSHQNKRAYEQAQRRIREYNAKVLREYKKAMREFELKRRAYKRKTEQRDANFQREYKKTMREYNAKVRANHSLLQRVERQYPGIKARSAEAVRVNSTEIISEDQSSANEIVPENQSSANRNSSKNEQYRRNRSRVKHYRSPRRNIRSESGVDRFGRNGQRAYENERRVRADAQRRRQIERHNAKLLNEYEKKKREYDKAVKEAKRMQRKVAKYNEEVRKRNEQIRRDNAARAAQRNAQGAVGWTYQRGARRPNYQRDTGHDLNWKPYKGKNCLNCPRYMRDD
jgi:hypothetical protein